MHSVLALNKLLIMSVLTLLGIDDIPLYPDMLSISTLHRHTRTHAHTHTHTHTHKQTHTNKHTQTNTHTHAHTHTHTLNIFG